MILIVILLVVLILVVATPEKERGKTLGDLSISALLAGAGYILVIFVLPLILVVLWWLIHQAYVAEIFGTLVLLVPVGFVLLFTFEWFFRVWYCPTCDKKVARAKSKCASCGEDTPAYKTFRPTCNTYECAKEQVDKLGRRTGLGKFDFASCAICSATLESIYRWDARLRCKNQRGDRVHIQSKRASS